MQFKNVTSVKIPDGAVLRLCSNEGVLWARKLARYVSLGDSIAAGHTINAEWGTDYGEKSQYGENGNLSTAIVPGSYTDLIRIELADQNGGMDYVSALSFAHSGDTVADLMEKLTHDVVKKAISEADLVTISIGANDVLQPAMSGLGDYIDSGSFDKISANVENNLAALSGETGASYKVLFDTLTTLNPKATFVFTTVYNPYKYLYVERSTSSQDYKDGFLGPIMWAVPDIYILGYNCANAIRAAFLSTSAVTTLFSRVNAVGTFTESCVTGLNDILRSRIISYDNPNVIFADTKAVFDAVPDRPVSAPKHYNDLVSVEPTRGYNVQKLDWGQFWANIDWGDVLDTVGNINTDAMEKIAADAMEIVVNSVILPDVDPHPEWYGHHALKCSFADALRWTTIPRRTITYHANGGTGTMEAQTVVALDGNTAYANIRTNTFGIPSQGYYFTGWKDASGNAYTSGQLVGLNGNLDLYAQWSDIYAITVRHSEDSSLHGPGDTGPMEYYALWIDGTEQPDLGKFSNGARTYQLHYGSQVGVIAKVESGEDNSYVSLNGTIVNGKSADARYTFTVTSHMDIHFEWNYRIGDWAIPQSYWNCYVNTY